MKIESVEVIPSTKESKFEDVEHEFEVFGMTTSFDEWETFMIEKIKQDAEVNKHMSYDDQCRNYALKHQAFMTAPIAIFGNTYMAATREIELGYLDLMPPLGPLFSVYKRKIEDTQAGKTVFRPYINRETFKEEVGVWYPLKEVCVIRYGKMQ